MRPRHKKSEKPDGGAVPLAEPLLRPDFWIKRMAKPDALLLESSAVAALNERIAEQSPAITPPLQLPGSLPGADVARAIRAISQRPVGPRYDEDGKLLEEPFWAELERRMALGELPKDCPLGFGVALRRTALRSFPTDAACFKAPKGESDLDRFIETALYPGEPLARLWPSADGKWSFVQTINYTGWMRSEDLALADDREALEQQLDGDANDFLLATGRQARTVFNPFHPLLSEMLLDMGTRLPLAAAQEDCPETVDGQSVAGNHFVLLPTAEPGSAALLWRPALLPGGEDARRGYLPLSRAHILRQVFKCLGERYGWGGMYQARDCASLVVDVFRCFGLQLPRNSGQQSRIDVEGLARRELPEAMDIPARKDVLTSLRPGALLFLEGHVMFYLGQFEGEFYAIQDVYEFYLPADAAAGLRHISANQVMVTSLGGIFRANGKSFLESLEVTIDFS